MGNSIIAINYSIFYFVCVSCLLLTALYQSHHITRASFSDTGNAGPWRAIECCNVGCETDREGARHPNNVLHNL